MANDKLTPGQLAEIDALWQARRWISHESSRRANTVKLVDAVPALLAHIRAQDARIAALEGALRDITTIEHGYLIDASTAMRERARAALDGTAPKGQSNDDQA